MKENFSKQFSLFVFALFLSIFLPAQLTVNTSQSALQLAQLLTGPGVQIMNPQIHSGAGGYGKYTATGTPLNVSQGVLLTTGLATNAIGPNNTSSKSSHFGNLNTPNTYPMLTNYTGKTIYEYAEIEFDIIPQGTQLKFDYVFASEEYEEWVCSQFNDVFGFFISGPGITPDPGNAPYRNIARLPNNNTVVSINTVNQNTNSQYYNNNNNGVSIQYDGFTDVLTATATVQPCQTYHLKLVVADASDKCWDSGVFIEQISCNSPTLSATTVTGLPHMIEGCNNGTITFTRTPVTSQPQVVQYWLGGSATNGTDFPLIGGSSNPATMKQITIPANQASTSITIAPIADNLNEPIEWVTVYLGNPNCQVNTMDSIQLFIHNQLALNISPSVSICVGGNTQLTATGNGSTYSWAPTTGLSNPNISNPIASPSVTTTYTVTATLGTCTATKTVTVTVNSLVQPSPITGNTILCPVNCSGNFFTRTQGGWGASPSGGNGGTYLHANFAAAFPAGLKIGCNGGNSLTFTNAQAITNFLPQGSTPAVLPSGTFTNTISGSSVLWGQVTAAMLNVGFDLHDANFSSSSAHLGNLVFASGTFAGMTVQQVINEANNKIGGCGSSYSLSALCNALDQFNNNYNNCNNNYLVCVPSSTTTLSSSPSGGVWTSSNTNVATVNSSGVVTTVGPGTTTITYTISNSCGSASVTTIVTVSPNLVPPAPITGNLSVCIGGTTNLSSSTSGGVWSSSNTAVATINSSTGVVTGVSAGTATITYTITTPCGSASVSALVTVNTISASISAQTNVNCFGGSNGSATVSVSGGTAPYTYSWNTMPAQTGATATNLSAGAYVVTVTSANGCSATASVTISQPTQLSVSASAYVFGCGNNIPCYGGSNGNATATVSGGTAPYTYLWMPGGATGATASGLAAGTYTVTVTDANNCTASATVVLTQPPAVSASISASANALCFGGSGSATAIGAGGMPPYTYSWNTTPVQTTATATGLLAGSYTVTVKDANNCTATATVSISQPAAVSASISAQTNVNCFGSSNGSATITASGGTAPYSYSWNTVPVQTGATATGLAAGTYIATVTDANNCTATVSVSITQPQMSLSASISGSVNANCFGGSGSATVSASGGTAPYSYSWNTIPVQTSATAGGLAAGTYIATVTDANGCTATASVIISQPQAALSASISGQINANCFGGNGSATVLVSGGTAPYSYSWNTTPVQTSATATGLAAGTYVVTIFDANQCSTSASVTITQPSSPLNITISAQTNVSCFGGSGSATASVSGGTAPYSYSWNTTPVQTSATATLSAGTYVVTVVDANGCSGSATVCITQPHAGLSASISGSVNANCFGGSGSATVSASGGTAPYSYSWNTIPVQTSATASGLLAGTYIATVTDANGCTATASVIISQPQAALSASISGQINANCFGGNGSATVSVSGGTAPYSYSWNTTPAQTSATATGLAAGTYVVTIFDANQCSTSASVTITQPQAALSVSISGQINASCFGNANGSASVSVSGGTAPYTYSWNTTPVQTSATATGLAAGAYIVTVVDANGCSGSASVIITQPQAALSASISAQNINCFGGSGSATVSVSGGTAPYSYSWNTTPVQTSATATGLAAGSYVVTVLDANGCSASASVTISQPAQLSVSVSASLLGCGSNITCFGGADGTAMATVSGGTAPYSYSWSPSGGTGAIATGLAAGTYTVTVTDANNCSASGTITLTQPPAVTATISAVVNANCFGGNGSATVVAGGGMPPYSYSWNTTPVQTSATATGLAAGVYVVTVTDASQCSASATVTISQPQSSVIASISAQINASCFGGANGSATVIASGGTAPYSYSWNTTPAQTSATATGLAAGTYIVTVVDANGCSATASVIISQPQAALSASISGQINANCFGSSNGSATVNVSGGTAPYTYSWNTIPVQTSATATGLAAGSYIVTVLDANGCSASASVTISQPQAALSASISAQNNVSCFGGNNGSASLSISGGTAPYSISWNTTPVQTSATATGLAAGTYVATIIDANGCSASVSVIITQPALSLSASISAQVNVPCFGGATGSATVVATGGTAPYSYSWNTTPAQTGATATGLSAGTYFVTVVDANGCQASASVCITQPSSGLSASISGQINASCFGSSSGSATVSASGGTAPYSYSWNTIPVQTSATASGLAAGTYIATVVDANGCSATATVIISQPQDSLSASISAQANVDCFGNSNGSATVSVSGGTAPYSFSWNTTPVQTSATATGLAAGAYVVTIVDANGCSASASVIITQPALALSASISAQNNPNCFGGHAGTATVLAVGGTAPYSYSWNTTPVQTSATATGLGAGTYVVTVTDANQCSASATVIITQPSAPLSATISAQTNVSCFGGNDGSATVSVSGGTAPYSYIWNLTPLQFTATATGLAAGTYVVSIVDANNCQASATVTITQPQLSLSASISAQINNSCFGDSTGSATVSVIGGTAPYSYSWNTVPVQATATATGLAAGTYVATVVDANGCSATVSVTIMQPPASLSASISAQTNVDCFGNSNGSAAVSVSGGTAPYLISWNTTPIQLGASATGLGAGTYIATIIDANGCSASVSVTITEPSAPVSASISASANVSCFGGANGSATVTASGGTAPYSYSWNTIPVQTSATATGLVAGTYIVTVLDANGCPATASVSISQPLDSLDGRICPTCATNVACFGDSTATAIVTVSGGTPPYSYSWNTNPVQTTQMAVNLPVGTYIVVVTDANGCQFSDSVTITGPSAPLSASISASSNISCFGSGDGSATVSVTGGTAPYSYSWNTIPAQTGANASGLGAGTYIVLVTDSNGCTASASVTITQPQAALSASISAQINVNCFGSANGSATVAVTGGTAPYSYNWNTIPAQTGATASGLAAGTYVVTIIDANGCEASVAATITQPADSLNASISTQINASCFGSSNGSATVSVSGGTAPYTYSWNTIPVQTSATASGLAAGSYIVTIVDANGCSATASVTISQPSASLSASISAQTNVDCFGNSNGSATVSVSGGTAPYSYSWNTTPIQTGASASGLGAGTYIVSITDANGCTATASVIISQPSASLSASISAQTNVDCFGNSNGSATVSVSGGTAPYSYSWNTIPAQTSATASGLAAGSYIVTIIDANGCSATDSVIISAPQASLSASISAQTNVDCFGSSNGSATVSVSGGTAPYSYSWNTIPAQTSATASGLAAGTYIVTITDANGCSASASVIISGPQSSLSASISGQTNVDCFGNSNGSATVSVSGGTAPYSYSWNTIPAQTSATASGLAAGTYIVTITDANGCSASASVIISGPSASLSASISAQTNVNCFGSMNGSATVSVSGGTAPYAYSWNTIPVQTGAMASGLGAGTYIVTITDANGCSASASVSITEPSSALSVSLDSQINIDCFGSSNGSATVSVNGGTAPYSYSWNTTPIQTGATATGLIAGTYIATVTDANGCSANVSVTITQPASPIVASVSAQTNVSCLGGSNGSATVSVSGGTASYSYSWNTTPSQNTATATGLAAGTYVVTISDANDCVTSVTVVILQPQLNLSALINAQTDVDCFGNANGSASVLAIGGTAPYSYSWNTTPVQTGTTASGLAAGTYVVTVTDANGCTAMTSVTIQGPSASLSASISAQANVSCFGGSNGSATVSVSGGTGPYSYSWNTTPIQTGATASGLAAGSYIVTITDANGCSASASVIISQPAASLAASISAQTNVSCFGGATGSATVSVSGGTAPYSYSWNSMPIQTGATANALVAGAYTVTVTDANGCSVSASVIISQPAAALSASVSAQTNVSCFGNSNGSATVSVSGGTAPYLYSWNTNPAQTGATASGLTAGAYIVSVVDANGCSVNVSVNITEPAALTLSSTVTDASCSFNNGSIDLGVSGGSMPFTYAWSGPSGFTASTQDVINLGGGTYWVTVTDANGCTATATMTIAQDVPIVVTSSSSLFNGYNISCNGGTNGDVNLSITGGSAPYTYAWSGPNGYASTSQNLSGLGAGAYTVIVSDNNGCSATHTVTLNEPAALSGFMVVGVANCTASNGSLNLALNGGVMPYTYLWSNGSTTQNISGLGAGTYTVMCADANGCTTTLTGTVSNAMGLTASGSVQNILCHDSNDGHIDVTINNGMAPYTYSWSNGATTEDLTNVGPGTYILSVTDGQGCSMTDTFIVSQPAQLSLSLYSPVLVGDYNIGSFGGSNGSIEVTVNGGTSPYTYVWSNGSTSQNLDGLPAGTYSVTCTDANGCVASGVIVLRQPLDLAMPTGFSPNADGQNDFFVVQGLDAFPNSRLEIYNRWGNLVFDADNYNNKWFGVNNNGDHLPDATYFVILSVNGGEITLKNYVDIRR